MVPNRAATPLLRLDVGTERAQRASGRPYGLSGDVWRHEPCVTRMTLAQF